MRVRDQRRPLRVDVELHRANGARPLQDPGERGHRLIVRGRVDQVAAAVDPGAGAPHADRVAERVAPLRAVVQIRVEATVVDDQRQALPRERDPALRHRAPGPGLHVDAAVAVGDERREAVLQRLVHQPADRRPVLAVAVDEAAVERREQTPALVVRHRHRSAHRRVRRLVPARDRTRRTSACGRTTRRTRRSAGSRPRCGTPSRRPPGSRRTSGPVPDHRPSPGSRCANTALIGGGQLAARCTVFFFVTGAAGRATIGRLSSCGPPFFGAFQL